MSKEMLFNRQDARLDAVDLALDAVTAAVGGVVHDVNNTLQAFGFGLHLLEVPEAELVDLHGSLAAVTRTLQGFGALTVLPVGPPQLQFPGLTVPAALNGFHRVMGWRTPLGFTLRDDPGPVRVPPGLIEAWLFAAAMAMREAGALRVEVGRARDVDGFVDIAVVASVAAADRGVGVILFAPRVDGRASRTAHVGREIDACGGAVSVVQEADATTLVLRVPVATAVRRAT